MHDAVCCFLRVHYFSVLLWSAAPFSPAAGVQAWCLVGACESVGSYAAVGYLCLWESIGCVELQSSSTCTSNLIFLLQIFTCLLGDLTFVFLSLLLWTFFDFDYGSPWQRTKALDYEEDFWIYCCRDTGVLRQSRCFSRTQATAVRTVEERQSPWNLLAFAWADGDRIDC